MPGKRLVSIETVCRVDDTMVVEVEAPILVPQRNP